MHLMNLTKLDEGENHLPAPLVVCPCSVEDLILFVHLDP